MNLKSRLATLVLASSALTPAVAHPEGPEPQFDHRSYQPTTLDELIAAVPKIDEGMDIFLKKRQFDLRVEGKPKRCTALIVGRVLRMLGVEEPPETSHCMRVSRSVGGKRELFVQDALVKSLREHVRKGDIIRVYAVYFYYAAESGNLGILVNDFVDPSHHESVQPNSAIQPSAGAAARARNARALARNCDVICAGVSDEFADNMSDTTPVTAGAAMLVP